MDLDPVMKIKESTCYCRFEPDMLAFSGCYYGGGDKERRELGKIRKRWKTLRVSEFSIDQIIGQTHIKFNSFCAPYVHVSYKSFAIVMLESCNLNIEIFLMRSSFGNFRKQSHSLS